jgi:glycosyltransferase involved in cell wall biosynthesis
MKIAIVYDCLFPNTVGGAERWYRNLAERLGERRSVTYLTRRQWGEEGPGTPFETIAVSPESHLYTRSGRRRIWPPLRFGLGVFWHLLRHGRTYDAVHTASFPYFHLLGARMALWLTRSPARLIGFAVERLCLRLPDRSFTFSRLAEERLREYGHRAPILRLTGEYASDPWAEERSRDEAAVEPFPPMVISAGRHIPEKHVPEIPAAIAAAREQVAGLRCVILGDGPDFEATGERIRELGLEESVELAGRVDHDELMRRVASASCLLHPSEREGYGMVVIEAFSLGTPAIVVRGSENAATELVEDGVNGFVVDSTDPEAMADAIVRAVAGGSALRGSALDWYRERREELSIEKSLAEVEDSYAALGEG